MKLKEIKPLNEAVDEHYTSPSADEILEVLTKAYRHLEKYRDQYQNFEIMTRMYNMMREPLLKDDVSEYQKVRDYLAGKYPDAYDELFDEIALAGQ